MNWTVINTPLLAICGGISGLQPHLPYMTIIAGEGLKYSNQSPLVTREVVVRHQHDVIHRQVLLRMKPFLTFLQSMQIVLAPSSPKLVGDVLDAARELPAIIIGLLEASGRGHDHSRLLSQQAIWCEQFYGVRR